MSSISPTFGPNSVRSNHPISLAPPSRRHGSSRPASRVQFATRGHAARSMARRTGEGVGGGGYHERSGWRHREVGSMAARRSGGTAEEALAGFSPLTRTWFQSAFAAPTAAQEGAWKAIGAGQDALVIAPTGSGK